MFSRNGGVALDHQHSSSYGISWPTALSCSNLPSPPALCLSPPSPPSSSPTASHSGSTPFHSSGSSFFSTTTPSYSPQHVLLRQGSTLPSSSSSSVTLFKQEPFSILHKVIFGVCSPFGFIILTVFVCLIYIAIICRTFPQYPPPSATQDTEFTGPPHAIALQVTSSSAPPPLPLPPPSVYEDIQELPLIKTLDVPHCTLFQTFYSMFIFFLSFSISYSRP